MQKLIDKLAELGACKESIIWVEKQESLQDAWENCNIFEWLHWLTAKLDCKGQTDKIRVAYYAAVAPAWAAYYAAVAPAWAAYIAAIAPAWAAYNAAIAQAEVAYDAVSARAAYDAAVAPARAAYDAAVAPAKAAYDAAVASINCEACNKLREIVSFEDVLKHGNF